MRIIEKKYMSNHFLYTLINGPDLHKFFSQLSKFLTFIFKGNLKR